MGMKKQVNARLFELDGNWITQKANRDCYYRAFYDKEKRNVRIKSLKTNDFDEAKLRFVKQVMAAKHYDNADPRGADLQRILARYYAEHARHIPSATSAMEAIRRINRFFHGAKLGDMSIAKQREFVRWLKEDEQLSDGTVKRVFSTAKAAVNFAVDNEELTHSIAFLKKLPSGNARDRVLTPDEVRALFANCQSEHLYVFLMLAFNTMSRPGALLDLTRFQCDTKKQIINLNPPNRTQTKKFRPVVRMTKTITPIIESTKAGYLVNLEGEPLTSVRTAFRATRRRAGLTPDVIPYTIRHTMASECSAKGVPHEEIAAFLGHKRPGTTGTYLHLQPSYLANAACAIDKYFEELQLPQSLRTWANK